MTTEDLEQLMQAHKCGFAVFTCDEGYCCELYSYPEQGDEMVGHGSGPTIVEAVYEALKSKMGSRLAAADDWTDGLSYTPDGTGRVD